MNLKYIVWAIVLAATATANAAPVTTSLSAAQAEAVIAGCKAYASQHGRSHSIAVYDAGANPVALLRMDGNTVGVTAFAMEKAKAFAMWRFATSGMEEAVKNTPGFADAPGVVTVAGGVPIYSEDGEHFLGAAAASGEPPLEDEACAEAGIQAAGLNFERSRD